MPGVRDSIAADLTQAVKGHDALAATTLRMLFAAVRNEELSRKGAPLAENDFLRVIEREAKRRREAAEAYEKGSRPEAAEKERAEEAILRAYLPPVSAVPSVSDAELETVIREAAARSPGSPVNAGKVMSAVMAKFRGRADGARVRTLVSRILEA